MSRNSSRLIAIAGLAAAGALVRDPSQAGSAGFDGVAQAQIATRIAPPPADAGAGAASDPVPQFPPVWIGVRITPLPEALAAQLQRSGLMIANIAEDGPAAQAGLDRFDVLLSIDGAPLETIDDLRAAVGAAAGRQVAVRILRGGQEQTLQLTPRSEQPDGPVRFRYEEPDEAPVRPFATFHGGRLKADPQGRWLIEPLGQLDDLPARIREHLQNVPDALALTPGDVFGFAGQWPALDDAFVFNLDDDVDVDASFSVTEVQNGASLSVQRGRDGSVTVERADAAGNRSQARFENMEQLKQQDPEAHELVRRRFGMRIAPRVVNPGNAQDLIAAQRDFERRLEEQLDAARERTRDMLQRLQPGRPPTPAPDATTQLRLEVRRDADGRYQVEVERDGRIERQQFDSLDELRQKAPEVFDGLQEALDRLSRGHGMSAAAV